ncbi:hypothetical protein D3C71_784370 [compost metagenome]
MAERIYRPPFRTLSLNGWLNQAGQLPLLTGCKLDEPGFINKGGTAEVRTFVLCAAKAEVFLFIWNELNKQPYGFRQPLVAQVINYAVFLVQSI